MLLGNIISYIRNKKNMTKTELSELTKINIGHLTHIEKGDRNPSYETLDSICTALEIPTRLVSNAYHKKITQEQIEYNYINYLPINKIPAISIIEDFIECPCEFSNAAFAYKMPDTSMAPIFSKNSYIFIEPCGNLQDGDIGFFKYNKKFFVRKLLYRNSGFVLKANNKNYNNIKISSKDDFIIIGKAYI